MKPRHHPSAPRIKTQCRLGELAKLYYPDSTYKTALRLFHHELECTPGLMKALTNEGYKRHQRVLTYRQLNVITAYLGEVG
ncbi:MAG: DUF4248 domain-containing protein [Bacteroidaceae bacterium]|nr:DUF4248 domain-containing protein [Bacteroidaceae bacterium]